MTASLKIGGALKTVHTVQVKIGGALKNIHTGHVKISGALKEFFQAYTPTLLSDRTISATTFSPTVASAGIRLNSDGKAQQVKNGAVTDITGEWIGDGTPANYSARATVVSGAVSSGTTGSWLNLGTTRDWTRTSSGGFEEVVLDIAIRLDSTGATETTGRITLQAEMFI